MSDVGVETGSEYVTSVDNDIVDEQTNLSSSRFQVLDVTGPVYIFTDEDSIVYSSFDYNDENARLLQPLDAIGNEYMTISFGVSDLHCSVVTLEPGTSVNVFTGSQILIHNSLKSFSEIFTTNQTGSLFSGDKPFALFCGTDAGSEYGISWYQVSATHTWGTYYVTPVLAVNGSGQISAKLKIVANSNNTVIEVHGDFDGIYVLLSRGDSQELETDPSVIYNITSNFPVGVAVLYQDNPGSATSFHMLSPVESFMDNPVILGNTYSVEDAVFMTSTNNHGNATNVVFNSTNLNPEKMYLPWQELGTFTLYARRLQTGIDVTASTSLYKDFSNVSPLLLLFLTS